MICSLDMMTRGAAAQFMQIMWMLPLASSSATMFAHISELLKFSISSVEANANMQSIATMSSQP